MKLPVHHSWLVSPYSAKTRAYLRYKEIPFEDRAPTALQLNGRIKKAVGRAIMPTVELPDGTWLQDSSLIIDHFEAAHPAPGIVPPGPTQRLAALLIELYADEWMSMADLHYRWNIPENAAFAIDEFARNGMPRAPLVLSRPVARKIAAKMQGYRPKLGITAETGPGIEAITEGLLAQLDAHFADHPFLLGGRPCIGDFALYGPLWSHLFRDPGTTALFDPHPHLRRWLDALRTGTSPGEWLADDAVPASLDPVFREIFAEFWPYVGAVQAALEAWRADHPEATRAPRALGDTDFTVGGRAGRRRLLTFTAWMAQRPLDARDGADAAWLEGVGGHAFAAAAPTVRQEMASFKLRLA